MKLIHTADIHLDSKMETHFDSKKAAERRAEILETFVSLIDYALSNDVEAILISGDLFDVKKISATTRNRIVNAIVSNSSIDFFYLQGNHDMNSFLDAFEELPCNLHIFNDKWTCYEIKENSGVYVYGIEMNGENQNSLYDSLFLSFDKFNIVMLHGQEVASASADGKEQINISGLKNKNIDYLALGHIHAYKEEMIDPRCLKVYCGCLDPRGYDETGEHGFVLLDIDEDRGTYTHEFIPFASRRVFEVNVDVSEANDTADVIDMVSHALILQKITSKDLVKIILCGQVGLDIEIDELSVLKRFENAYWHVKISNETSVKVDVEAFLLDKSLKGAFVREVMADESLNDDEKGRIISYGLAAIRKEKIDLCD